MLIRGLAAAFGVAVLLNLGGCATPATSQAMTVQPSATAAAPHPKLKGAVAVANVTGGKETNPLWTSQVDKGGFQKALQDSLAIAGYLATDPATAKYKVSADLLGLDQPFVGFTMEVKSDVKYTVAGPSGARAYPIKATGSATVSDAFVGIERLRIANERSISENIKEFLKLLPSAAD